VGADGLTVVLVLGSSESAQDDALLGGHDLTSLALSVDARNRGPDPIAVRSPAPWVGPLCRITLRLVTPTRALGLHQRREIDCVDDAGKAEEAGQSDREDDIGTALADRPPRGNGSR
jgi:hypothetical protein